MNGREALRRYLEQRRDMGETELVLDTLSIEEAMKLLGAAGASAPSSSSGNWRSVLNEAGSVSAPRAAAPSPERAEATTKTATAQDLPETQAPAKAGSPFDDVPAGLSVGGASRALADDPAARLSSLPEIAAVIAKCTRCSLYATALNPVPGVGNPNADFMCVGEAPGANEDAQGVPFVGQAGQLLTKILEAINLSRDDVFIANVLKHRPPGNRNPLPEEVVACSPYLVRQIELVKPKVLLALGTFAAQTLLETKQTIGKLRGQVHRYHGVPLIVTYHPAALLRNPAWKRPTWEDVQLARRILDSSAASGA